MAFPSLPKTLHRLLPAYLRPPTLGSSRCEQQNTYERISNRKHLFQIANTHCSRMQNLHRSDKKQKNTKKNKKRGEGFGTNSPSLPPSRVCYFHSALTWQKSLKHNGSENVTFFTCHRPFLESGHLSYVSTLNLLSSSPGLTASARAALPPAGRPRSFTPPGFCSKCLLCLNCLPSSLPGKHFIIQCHLSWKDRWINPLIQDCPLPNT